MTLERVAALVVGLGLLALAVVAVRRSAARGEGPVTTLSVFSGVWALALLLFAIPWVRYTETSAGVWLMVYGSIATFIAGTFLARRSAGGQQRAPEPEQPDGRRLRIAWLATAILGLIGFAGFVNAVDAVIGWQSLFKDPEVVRAIQTTSTEFSDTYGPLKLLTYFGQIAFLLWTLALREGSFTGRWRPAILLGPLSLVPFMLTGDRTLILLSLVWAGFFQLIYRPPAINRRLVAVAVGAIVLLVLVFGVLGARVGKTIDGHPEIAENLTTRTGDSLALPYVYVTANVPTFAGVVDDPIAPTTYGQLSILPVVKVLHGLGLWGQPPEVVGAFYPVPFETFNNYSWLGTMYLDFGPIGVLILPLILAYLTTLVMIRAIRRRTLLSVWTGSLLIYCVAFSPMLPKFFDTLTWQYLLLGPLVILFIGPAEALRAGLRRGLVRVRARPWIATPIAGLLLIAATAGVAGALTAGSAVEELPVEERALGNKLKRVARVAARTRGEQGRYPSSFGLASRLHVKDPATLFVAAGGPTDAAFDANAVAVYSDGRRLVLRVRAASGNYVSLDTKSFDDVLLALEPGGVPRLGKQLVVNGAFTDGLATWDEGDNGIAYAELTSPGLDDRRAVTVTGTGQDQAKRLHFLQTVHVRAPKGSCFTARVRARRSGLSRALRSGFTIVYRDGTEEEFVVGPKGEGIPPGSGDWRVYEVTGKAEEPVGAIIFDLVETGRARLTGRVELDDLSLRRSCLASKKGDRKRAPAGGWESHAQRP